MEEKNEHLTFSAWLFSKQEIVEKTVGLAILFLEIFNHLQDIFEMGKEQLTTILNLSFLVFIYFILKRDLGRRFSLKENESIIRRALRVPTGQHFKERAEKIVRDSNTFIGQLRNIRYFFLAEAALYFFLLLESLLKTITVRKPLMTAISHVFKLTPADMTVFGYYSNHGFHLLFDLCSYVGAFFLLRCFFVMYLPTIDEEGNDILNKKTNIFIGLLFGLMVFDVFVMRHSQGHFTTEFVCGIANAVVFILFIARFENKILDIPPVILCILYIYAILQTSLPFVTGGTELLSGIESGEHGSKYLDDFKGVVLTLCLVGKVALSAVLLYVLNTGRIFYYFVTLPRLHQEEEQNWLDLSQLLEKHEIYTEPMQILYEYQGDGSYTARIPGLISDKTGHGASRSEARSNLLGKIVEGVVMSK